MRALLSILHKRFTYFLLSAFAIGSLASCQKENTDYPEIPHASVMAYNLASDRSAVAFNVGNVPISGALAFGAHTGNYVPVVTGNQQVGAFDVNGNAPMVSQSASLAENAKYSAFLVGSNGNYSTVVTLDNNGNGRLSSGTAWVRYVHAVSGSSSNAMVTIGGESEEAAFGTVSEFVPVGAGSSTVKIASLNNFETSRTMDFEINKLYTIMFVGDARSTNPQLAPQANIMVNGTTE